MTNFTFDTKTDLLLSFDFTVLFGKYFYAEANYDYVNQGFDFISLSPGIRFFVPNEYSSFNFAFGMGLLSTALYLVPSFKYEYQFSKNYSLGLEFKYPLGSSHLSQLYSNINFVIHL